MTVSGDHYLSSTFSFSFFLPSFLFSFKIYFDVYLCMRDVLYVHFSEGAFGVQRRDQILIS